MGTNFYLVRHANKQNGIGDVAISSDGILQAQVTARHLSGLLPVKKIVSSPLKRARETALIIANKSNAAISEDIRLRERANWGDIPGQTFEAFVQMWERCTTDRDFIPPVGDSARMAGERLSTCLLELANENPQDTIIILTHGGLITDFLVNVISDEELRRKNPNIIAEQSYLIKECSITKVRCEGGIFILDDIGCVEHLL
ncbi:broad specificity phosphatase PhoE [Paenibacillus castaneae]|uniref:histidine phosphatase family protein n=1 Tax=Paenibacillus castaneae TaxID=474957 RepID=UPI000C9AB3E0|nr:histidine phosphatase family protein [Paenibacillus castaneae]NIK76647.1 broad specificity phosphatase PhoE [Paenibacillus castaneae]